jgi:phosphate acetyltransferase
MSSPLQRILDRAAANRRRVVFPEPEDRRVLEAAGQLSARGIVAPILVGDRDRIAHSARQAGIDLKGVEIADPAGQPLREACRQAIVEALTGKSPEEAEIDRMLADPLYIAAAMVRASMADGLVAGAAHPTAETIRASLRVLRCAPGNTIVSSFFLMCLSEPTPSGDRLLAFADCGLVPAPDEQQLAEIAIQTAASFRLLAGEEPRVALLSFSTLGSASHDSVSRVSAARDRVARLAPDLAVDGELQVDAALIPEVAASKAPGSGVAGRANVLVFPNLDAGNIGYKLVQRLARAEAIGPLCQGLTRPANDLSRGCSVNDIVMGAAVTAVQAAEGGTPYNETDR